MSWISYAANGDSLSKSMVGNTRLIRAILCVIDG
jgi:hypothetical protein